MYQIYTLQNLNSLDKTALKTYFFRIELKDLAFASESVNFHPEDIYIKNYPCLVSGTMVSSVQGQNNPAITCAFSQKKKGGSILIDIFGVPPKNIVYGSSLLVEITHISFSQIYNTLGNLIFSIQEHTPEESQPNVTVLIGQVSTNVRFTLEKSQIFKYNSLLQYDLTED